MSYPNAEDYARFKNKLEAQKNEFDIELSKLRAENKSLLALCGKLSHDNFVLNNKLKIAEVEIDFRKLSENKKKK